MPLIMVRGKPLTLPSLAQTFAVAGAYTYNIPTWANFIDVILLGAGGGGAGGNASNGDGVGGKAGVFATITLRRGVDIPSSLTQITGVIGDAKSNIRNIEARTANSQAVVDIVLDISDLKHLETIVNGLRKIPGVRDVQRLQKI